MPKTGLGFVCLLAFIMVLSVLLRLLLCSLCAVVFVVCRRRCYMIATEVVSCFGSCSLLWQAIVKQMSWVLYFLQTREQ